MSITAVHPRDLEGTAVFNFYTYDPTGRDVIIPIRAKDEDEAWDTFDSRYGSETMVDQMIKA